jgi:hypothetical protein
LTLKRRYHRTYRMMISRSKSRPSNSSSKHVSENCARLLVQINDDNKCQQ